MGQFWPRNTRSIIILLSKIFEFTSNAVIFFLKKMKCDIFIEKREKQNKSRKNKLKFKKRPKKNLTIYRKESGTTVKI